MILGIDVGGTHTDAVLIEGRQVLKKTKVVTNRDDLGISLLEVSKALVDAETARKLERVVLSTTISTNAIVENKTSPVGMILANGPGIPPSMLTINENSHFVSGYVNHRGIPVTPVDQREVEIIADNFLKRGIVHMGIVGKFSTRSPRLELEIEDIAGPRFDHISLGHRMSGNLNFPRRIATTYLNAAIWETYRTFIETFNDFVNRFNPHYPIFILKADGGTLEINQSVHYPAQTILSGPAASVMGILALTDCPDDAVGLDIGGTTTDIALFADGVPLLETEGVTIGPHKTLIRGLRTRSIGVGGDSVVRYDGQNFIIGPERLGPAASLGGPAPTPTDAMIVLGLTSIGDREKAEEALMPLARQADRSLEDTAQTVFDETCRLIVRAVSAMIKEVNNQPVYTIHELLEGKVLKPKVLHVVGGPAEAMAPRIAELLDCRVSIPPHVEVANAIGAALARTTTELTVLADTEKKTLTVVEEGFQVPVPANFSRDEAVTLCLEHLKERALSMGADEDDLEMEVTENQSFNMVRGFSVAGRNIRIRAQVKPGLIGSVKRGPMP